MGLVVLSAAPAVPHLLSEARLVEPYAPHRFDSLRWLRQHATPGSTVLSSLTRTAELYTGLHCLVPQRTRELSDVLRQVVWRGADYVHWDPLLGLLINFDRSNLPMPRLDLWLDGSSCLKRIYASPYDRIYRVRVPKAFSAAYLHYLAGCRADPPARAEEELSLALHQFSDFPDARRALAELRMASQRPESALPLLQRNLRQYPCDVKAALDLAACEQRLHGAAAARQCLQQNLAVLKALGAEELLEPLRRALREIDRR
ncbi:MAG: tetratricopeptide repeat protein [Candidatus Xenobia bacterium]